MKNRLLLELESCIKSCERYLDKAKKLLKSKVQKDALNTDAC